MINFYIATLFPEMVEAVLGTSIIGRARKAGYLGVTCLNIREFSMDKHHRVDDTPYGGGMGMLMQAQPIYDCYLEICRRAGGKPHVVYMSPQGEVLTQKKCVQFSGYENIMILCGHYEGVDERVLEEIVDEEISIGDYVLTGGELGAMVLVDSVGRLCEGVLADSSCFEEESHFAGLLEYPQYTRPPVWRGREVPEILLSGHHANIHKWRRLQSLERTEKKRPDLFARYELTDLDKRYLAPPKPRRRKKHSQAAEGQIVQNAQEPCAGGGQAGTGPQDGQDG